MSRAGHVVVRVFAVLSACFMLSAWSNHQVYDPDRDPAHDLEVAKQQAAQQGKKILISVGGNWCTWCLKFDKFLSENPQIKEEWDRTFVTVKVNTSEENTNEKFLAAFPRVAAVPLFFVLDDDGTLLSSQRTGVMEQGKTYSPERVREFVAQWTGQ